MAIQPNQKIANEFQPKDELLSHVWNALDKDSLPSMFANKIDEAREQIASDYKEDGNLSKMASKNSDLQSKDQWVESLMAQAYDDLGYKTRDNDSLSDFSKRAKTVAISQKLESLEVMKTQEPTAEKDELLQYVMNSLDEDNHPPMIANVLNEAKEQIESDYKQDGSLIKKGRGENKLNTKGHWVETLMVQAFDDLEYDKRSVDDLSDFSKHAREVSIEKNLEELNELKVKHGIENTAEDLRELGVGVYENDGVVDDLGFDPKDYDTVLENVDKMLEKYEGTDIIDIPDNTAEDTLEQESSYSPNTPRP